MNYSILQAKRDNYQKNKHILATATADSFEAAFDIEYTHNSTAIEGNTLTLIETKTVLEDRLSVGGKELREIYEVINHDKAYQYIKNCVAKGKPLDEKTVKDIHAIVMEGIIVGGVYRSVDVYISGAEHTPPTPNEMYRQIKTFYLDMQERIDLNPIEMAAWTHAEFVRIHPFTDSNGRTARLIMNYQLMEAGFSPIIIKKGNRLDYFNALEEYAVNNNLTPFEEMVAGLEEAKLDRYIQMISNEQDRQEDMEI